MTAACIAGVDGCPAGWLVVECPADDFAGARCRIIGHIGDLLTAHPRPATVAIDMPIGLPDRTSIGGRPCDALARSRLGNRQSAVFAIPSRSAVFAPDYAEACARAAATSDPPRRVAKQAYNLFPKIRELDRAISPALQDALVECHPELSFWAMNGEQPLALPKKVKSRPHPPGLDLRRALLEHAGFSRDFLRQQPHPMSRAGPDDLLDAAACAWTARRLLRGEACRLPETPDRDARGLRCEICY